MTLQDDSIEEQTGAAKTSEAESTTEMARRNDETGELRPARDAAWADIKAGAGLAWQSLSRSAGRVVKRFR